MIEGLLGDTEFFVGFVSWCCSHSHDLGGKRGNDVNQDIPLPCGLVLNAFPDGGEALYEIYK